MTPLPVGWKLFRGEREPGEVGGLDALRLWWLLVEMELAGVELSRGDGTAINVTTRPGGRGLDDELRAAIRATRPALLAWLDSRSKEPAK